MGQGPTNQQDSAETQALRALVWLLAQDDLVAGFLNATGADQQQLARLAADPAFLGGVLDYLLEDDARVIAFCDAHGLAYTAPLQARAALPGGQQVHWT